MTVRRESHPLGQETKTTKTVGARPGNGESDSSDLYTFLHTSMEPASSDMITLPSSNEEKVGNP